VGRLVSTMADGGAMRYWSPFLSSRLPTPALRPMYCGRRNPPSSWRRSA